MLKLEHDGRKINVKFSHRIMDTELNGERRCTWVQVIFPDDSMEFDGESICHPKDNYCKSVGRKLALANAMVDFDRNLRRAVWQEYHKHCRGGDSELFEKKLNK